VELQSVAAARLRGVVVRGTDGVAGAELVCWPDRTANAVARVVGDLGLRLERCGADGTFELRGLVEGVVTVRVLEGGGVAKVEEIAVVAGAVRDCRIELGPRSELRIEVRGVVSKELVAMVKTAGAPADDFGGLVALGDGRTGRWEGPRSEPSDVYLAWMDNKRDMVQLAMARAVPVDQHAVVFEISADQLPGGSLRGRLVDRSLGAVPSLVLSAHRVDGGGLVVRRLAITDTVGAFAIGPLPPGEYELRSSTAAGPPPRVLARVSLAAGRDEQLGDVVVAPETGR
jgi:hypothetical protein